MSKTSIQVIEYSCDICNARNIVPANDIDSICLGYCMTEPFGVKICAVPYGGYKEHVCKDCALKALKAAFHKCFPEESKG